MYDKFENDIKNLKGTFAIEDMNIDKKIIGSLKRVSEGKATYADLLTETKEKYTQRT